MTSVSVKTSLLFCTALLSAPLLVHAAPAHVHGTSTLQVALDGKDLLISFESPLDNLLGFEHAPRTEKQKQAAQATLARLQQPMTLFSFPAEAQCKAGPVELNAPLLTQDSKKHQHASEHHEHDHDHAELTSEMSFTCDTPSALKSIDIKLFKAFPNIRQLKVQAIGPQGQSATTLTADQPRFAW